MRKNISLKMPIMCSLRLVICHIRGVVSGQIGRKAF
jgi:hypothetical protein